MTSESPRSDVVTFLSDYGSVDESVGVISAVIRDLAPQAAIVHLTHDIAPFDVRAGSLALARAIAYVPAGVVLAIVDPRDATHRRPVAIEVAGGAGVLVGPDNGLLAPAVAMAGGAERAVHLDLLAAHLSDAPTLFRGRDIYAPVVAALLNGADVADVGTAIDPSELLPGTIPLPRVEGDTIVGEVLWIDRFGNVQLNISPDEIPDHWGSTLQVRLTAHGGDDTVRTVHRQASSETTPNPAGSTSMPAGAMGLIDDAYGMLAVTMTQRSAANELAVATGDRVVLAPLDESASNSETTGATTAVAIGRRDDRAQ